MATAKWTGTEADRATACCTRSRAVQPLMLPRMIVVGATALLLHGAAAWELIAEDSTTLLND